MFSIFIPYIVICITDSYCRCPEYHGNKTLRSYCTYSTIFWLSDCFEDPKSEPIMLQFYGGEARPGSVSATVRFEYDGGRYLGSFMPAPKILGRFRFPWHVSGYHCVGNNIGCIMEIASL